MTDLTALRTKVAQLASNLVHDCDPHSDRCWCFGEGDVRAYEAARAELREAESRAVCTATGLAVVDCDGDHD